ncbi:MAG: hypothetical protein L3K26_11270 [Candidatus Hydrogenedentes bacterium]|nr:hypothetical protein [Candidatus Hydrogenedentota bacterium]
MHNYERDLPTSQPDTKSQNWLTQPGPTESFLRTAPEHLLQDSRETAPPAVPDSSPFTIVGPTPSFANIR